MLDYLTPILARAGGNGIPVRIRRRNRDGSKFVEDQVTLVGVDAVGIACVDVSNGN